MSRPRDPWLALSRDASRLAADAGVVVGLRLRRLAGGGPTAQREAQRMVTEKATALVEAQLEVVRSVLAGQPAHAPQRALAVYRKGVSANRRRLARS
jgi:hypothetical protein